MLLLTLLFFSFGWTWNYRFKFWPLFHFLFCPFLCLVDLFLFPPITWICSIQTVLCKSPLNPHLFSELFLLSHHCTAQALTSAVSKGPQLFIPPQTETLTAQEGAGEAFVKRRCLLYVFGLLLLTISSSKGRESKVLAGSGLSGSTVQEGEVQCRVGQSGFLYSHVQLKNTFSSIPSWMSHMRNLLVPAS